ncbi:hypothetical protein EVAR_103621_1 [Eumeta japonica]|uniref:Uncharacterized protein n=1 Tax=Eumeta variegata TaxID=151549 RepID=A0A4C1ZFW0_EUMVA|nr:hypothetical protein EVAR_103621_1 [Eumeta japonica]
MAQTIEVGRRPNWPSPPSTWIPGSLPAYIARSYSESMNRYIETNKSLLPIVYERIPPRSPARNKQRSRRVPRDLSAGKHFQSRGPRRDERELSANSLHPCRRAGVSSTLTTVFCK